MSTTTATADLTTATPEEVDGALAEIYRRLYAAEGAVKVEQGHLESYQRAVASGRALYLTQADVDEQADRVAVAQAAVDAVHAETLPYDTEFLRRGGWARAWLVSNSGGHVHNSTACSTCYPTTRFVWLPQYSGHEEAEVVGDAGRQACTVCFPSAPVDVLRRASVIEEPERRAARLEREAAKAVRDAKRAEKAIATPEGEPLRVFEYRSPERVVAGGRGQTKVVPAADHYRTLETLAAAKTWLTDSQDGWARSGERPVDVEAVAAAIAHKVGTTAEVELAAAVKRAAKRG